MAIGARVKIVAGGMTQSDEVRSGGSYISQSDFRLHFGLGSAEKIESLEVRWPSGKVESFKDLAADRFYALLEGEGMVPAERIRPAHAPKASEPAPREIFYQQPGDLRLVSGPENMAHENLPVRVGGDDF